MAALGKAVSKTAAELGEALAKKKKTKVDELAPVANSRTNGLEYQSSMKRDLTPTELNQKYNVQPSAEYKAYQNDVAATRAGTTASPAPKATNLTTGKVEAPVAVKTEAPKAQGGVTGAKTEAPAAKPTKTSSPVSSGLKTVGAAGLMGAGIVGVPAIIEGVVNLTADQQSGDSSNTIIEWIKKLIWGGSQPPETPEDPNHPPWYLPWYLPEEERTAYVGGEDFYGDNGSGEEDEGSISSFFEGAADFISNNLMLVIGIITAVIILVLVSTKSKTTKKSKPSVTRTAHKTKGGSRV